VTGMTEDLITELSRLERADDHRPELDIHVQGHSSQAGASESGVGGAVHARRPGRTANNRIRITAQLVRRHDRISGVGSDLRPRPGRYLRRFRETSARMITRSLPVAVNKPRGKAHGKPTYT